MDIKSATNRIVSPLSSNSKVNDTNDIVQLKENILQDAEDSPNALMMIKESKKSKKFSTMLSMSNKNALKDRKIQPVNHQHQDKEKGKSNNKSSIDDSEKSKLDKIPPDAKYHEVYASAFSNPADPFGALENMQYVHNTTRNAATKIISEKGRRQLYESYKLEIDAGHNILETIKKFKELGTPPSLRELYNKTILKNSSYVSTANTILSKFTKPKQQEMSLKFLLEASGIDLKNRNINLLKSHEIMHNLSKARVLLTIKHLIYDNNDFVLKATQQYNLETSIPEIESIYNRFVSIVTTLNIPSTQIESEVESIVQGKDPIVSSAVSRLMLSTAKKIPLEFFKALVNENTGQALNSRNLFIQAITEASTKIDNKATAEVNKLIEDKTKYLVSETS